MAPIFGDRLGVELCVDFGYDTDQLGTFTREIPRPFSQREAAVQKARLAIDRTGLPIGVGSEGAFGVDPFVGVSPWNVELVVLIDAEREIEIVGIDQGPATFAHLVTNRWAEVEIFARDQGFPLQHLVVRPHGADDPRIRKDIASWSSLGSAFAWARRLAGDGRTQGSTYRTVQFSDSISVLLPLRLCLLGDFLRLVNLDAEVSGHRFQLGMPEKKSDCSKVFRSAQRTPPGPIWTTVMLR